MVPLAASPAAIGWKDDHRMAKKRSRTASASSKKTGASARSKAGGKTAKRAVEQYRHDDKTRPNNPPVGLVTPETDPAPPPAQSRKSYRYDPHLDPALSFDPQKSRDDLAAVIDAGLASDSLEDAKSALAALKKAQEPYLNWAGKAERTSFQVPTVSLHVHERIDPRTIIEAVRAKNGNGHGAQQGLFEQPDSNPPLREAVEFYKHPHGWTNRLIAGDSLLVMNSLLEKEGMAGKVQMAYIDPPYGVEYRSNFQPFVHQRNVPATDRDQDLTREPETLRAFRDTWALGLHSYLAYLRDRLLIVRNLLAESGSCFVQISDQNVHHAREILDEVFGPENFVVSIFLRKKGSQRGNRIRPINDYLLWYAKSREAAKIRMLYTSKLDAGDLADSFEYIELADGDCVRTESLEPEELSEAMTNGARAYVPEPLTSGGEYRTQLYTVEYDGRTFEPPANNCWKFNETGMNRIIQSGRLHVGKNQIRFKKYHTDFPYKALSNLWDDLAGATGKVYVVQTAEKAVQRCLLMTTEPGDLVLDITCGSGTTAVMAEHWGRRWITCDSSRVALALTKQRLITREYPYFQLRYPDEGIGSGFDFDDIDRITSTTIANDEPPLVEHLFDRPLIDKSKARVTGPFTVEAVPAPVVTPIGEIETAPAADESIAREGETLRQSEWRDELLRTGARAEAGVTMEFVRIEPLPGATWLHAEAEIKNDGEFRGKPWKRGDRAVIAFGPEHAPMEQRQVEKAWMEARELNPRPRHVVFGAFQFDPEAAKDIDEANPKLHGMSFFRAEMNDDLHTEDLKKKRSSNESFWLIGQPDVTVDRVTDGADKGHWVVEVQGFDYFNMKEGVVDSGGPEKIAMWMLDTDYDGRSLYPRQVFFPMAGEKEGWTRLTKTLKAEIDEERIEAYRGTKSLPFAPGRHRRIAVKVVDDRGFESLVIRDLPEGTR